MGNRRTREQKYRRKDLPLEKVQDLREIARLGMEKHRHPPVTGSDPITMHETTASCSTHQVKRMRPTEPTQIPVSIQPPTNNPSTSDDQVLQDFQIPIDANYTEYDAQQSVNVQCPHNEQTHVQHTPILNQHVNEVPEHTSPPPLPQLSTARRKTPRRIRVDDSTLASLEGKLPKRTIAWQCRKIIKEFFESKTDGAKCQLLLALLKSHCLAVVRKILGIKVVSCSEASNHVVRNLQSAFNLIGKTSRTKDRNAARRVLSESIVNKSTRQRRLLTHTSHIFKITTKTLRKYSSIREQLDTVGEKDCWAFVGRLPCIDMKLIDAVKELVQTFWKENTRPSSNQRDVLKFRKGSNEREPHVKHFLDMTQT